MVVLVRRRRLILKMVLMHLLTLLVPLARLPVKLIWTRRRLLVIRPVAMTSFILISLRVVAVRNWVSVRAWLLKLRLSRVELSGGLEIVRITARRLRSSMVVTLMLNKLCLLCLLCLCRLIL